MNGPDLSAFGYEIVKSLGEGATSTVYLARQTRLANRLVAIKAMRQLDRIGEVVDRERHVAGVLEHPNVLSFIDAIDVEGRSYLVMEYAAGGTEYGPLDSDRLIEAGIALADALAAAHELGIVHSDIKPSNILWTERGDPRLADFGTARVLDYTAMRGVLGFSPGWAPPSVRVDGTDPMSDVWSLAASLGSLATGTHPPEIRWDLVDSDLRAVLKLAMPAERSAMSTTATALRDALRNVLEDRRHRGESRPGGSQRRDETVLEAGRHRGPDETQLEAPPVVADGLAHGRSAARATGAAAGVSPSQAAPEAKSTRRLLTLGLVALALAAGAVLWLSRAEGENAALSTESSVPADEPELDSSSEASVPEVTVADVTAPEASVPEVSTPQLTADDRFVFASDRGGQFTLYELDEAGASPIVVEDDVATSPSLAPDAASIVYARTGGVRSVILADRETGATTQLSPDGVDSDEPVFSPDGAFIAWVSRENGNRDIVLYDIATGSARFVTTSSADDRSPSWSPDGAALVFRSDRTGNGDIYVLELASQAIEQRTSSPEVDDHPAMAADGRIAFERRVNGDAEVYEIVDEVTERVTTRDGFDGYPAYSGGVLFFVADNGASSWIQTTGGTRLGESSGVIRDLVSVRPS